MSKAKDNKGADRQVSTEYVGASIDAPDILTHDDFELVNNGLPPQKYDAFLLFHDTDIDLATKILETLESSYRLKVIAH